MTDANRYQKEFDLMMQELEAEAKRRTDLDRETTWKMMEKSFNAMANANKWTTEHREVVKKRLLDNIFPD